MVSPPAGRTRLVRRRTFPVPPRPCTEIGSLLGARAGCRSQSRGHGVGAASDPRGTCFALRTLAGAQPKKVLAAKLEQLVAGNTVA